jgi:Major intrinsic protein
VPCATSKDITGFRSSPGSGPGVFRPLEALSSLPVQQVAQRPDVKAKIVLRLIDDALISKVCASYLRDIIDADAEVRADCGEHGRIHQLWSVVMEGPTARELGQMLKGGPRSEAVTGLLKQYLERLGYAASSDDRGKGAEDAPWMVAAWIGAAYWFTASTSFANPAITIARSLTDTFSGVRPVDVSAFIVAQLIGAFTTLAFVRMLFATEKAVNASLDPAKIFQRCESTTNP